MAKHLLNLEARREGKEFIGDAVVRVLREVEKSTAFDTIELVAVVPRLLAPFGPGGQMEVVSVDVIIRG